MNNQRTWRHRRPCLEQLEHRHLLCSSAAGALLSPTAVQNVRGPGFDVFPTVNAVQSTGSSGSVAVAAATHPLSSIPALNSLPGARASLFLDFDGNFDALWGSDRNITTPAYDIDGDPTTFSDTELANIQKIWQQVAEDYAPFNINVTTVQPASFANGVSQRVAIGGDGLWSGGLYGGVSYVDSFTNSYQNTSFVFSENTGNGNAKYTAEAVSHEAGHAFGLEHQSQYNTSGTLIDEYYPGPGDGRAPIMGDSYSATRGMWWYGTSTSAGTYQDDLAVISRAANGFGYRPDDVGNTVSTAKPLNVSGSQVSGAGIITTTSDVDYFSFTTTGGQATLSANVPAGIGNLDARIELRTSTGVLIASADPSTSLSATVSANLAAGSYRVVVASHGRYGDVGSYTVTGTVSGPAALPTVSIVASDAAAAETVVGSTANTGTFTLTRNGSVTAALTVNFVVSGTALNGTDYNALGTSVTFAAGQSSVILTVTPKDDALAESTESVVVTLSGGASYGVGTASATVTIADNDVPAGPVNDRFSSRSVLTGSQVTAHGSNVGATSETGEPNVRGVSGGKSVWWSWTAPTSGLVTINTAGSQFDTTLGVYLGTSVNALTRIASNDDADYWGGVLTSQVRFSAVAGQTYQILVDGYQGAAGAITLNISQGAAAAASFSARSTSAAPSYSAASADYFFFMLGQRNRG